MEVVCVKYVLSTGFWFFGAAASTEIVYSELDESLHVVVGYSAECSFGIGVLPYASAGFFKHLHPQGS